MSREQYTPPTLTQPSITSNPPSTINPAGPAGPSTSTSTANPAGSSTAYAAFNITGANTFEDSSRPVHYLCGDCDSKVVLKKTDPIRCKECGYRVLYKERTNRMIQFEAR
ncbi:DNA-directed RNA polymerase core subunit rpc10 [Friedmanniomyces endolithicus]|uniref:DNA-directed RNA polymerase core subunit rpc10 n=1 Tax=Friedmanniomyces endolithicus TaxID=329885 RepID=A0A4U0UV11_9PEZI|nr:DNA-directed RNA polymerase core subunit rpc10 [Friedmanniomyces endolithicus]KAK0266040.1 DNA-directed RNA polymerase core subunit rpc10 [Friedmanniomyces endolithicus]KAK0272223.1 DNA-directed RNA polymerase core subunit rpc10 [Friedmanniomyces endolithicus]KAK0305418.1 DNA-directed RNA polymerase core subunit rpc10 [Friedmanniomyces endolithicus]KAK0305493.1 DNA-directed RNA polymerase core subunit rpc10 [Friedmanniomyces endolithicus]